MIKNFELMYISFWFMKSFVFLSISLSMDQTMILYESTFEICFVYDRKCGDMIFCDLNF